MENKLIDKENEQNEQNERDLKKVYNQIKLSYNQTITKFKSLSYIALALVFTGIILLFTLVYAYEKIGLGICVLLLFITLSIVTELINVNITQLKLEENKLKENILQENNLEKDNLEEDNLEGMHHEFLSKSIASLYQISFIVFITALVASIYMIPFINQIDYFTLDYIFFLPVLITSSIFMVYILRKIAHKFLKKNKIYQLSGSSLHPFPKIIKYVVVVLLIFTLQKPHNIIVIIPNIFIVSCIIIIFFGGILYLVNDKR